METNKTEELLLKYGSLLDSGVQPHQSADDKDHNGKGLKISKLIYVLRNWFFFVSGRGKGMKGCPFPKKIMEHLERIKLEMDQSRKFWKLGYTYNHRNIRTLPTRLFRDSFRLHENFSCPLNIQKGGEPDKSCWNCATNSFIVLTTYGAHSNSLRTC